MSSKSISVVDSWMNGFEELIRVGDFMLDDVTIVGDNSTSFFKGRDDDAKIVSWLTVIVYWVWDSMNSLSLIGPNGFRGISSFFTSKGSSEEEWLFC